MIIKLFHEKFFVKFNLFLRFHRTESILEVLTFAKLLKITPP